MKVLLDINVVLDVFLARDPWLADSAAVVQAGLDGKISPGHDPGRTPGLTRESR